ncbi:MAG: N-6 DNA methylase [Pseudomonadota bacterium]|nr:N-6 DNA methylase [Pseudomonadota bacterium]
MAKRIGDGLSIDSLTLEGSLFMPDLLEKAALGELSYQREADYHIPKGIKLHDEYGRSFQIACAQWKIFAPNLDRQDVDPMPAARVYAMELLRDALGYQDLQPINEIELVGRRYPVDFMACGRVPVIVAPYDLGLDEPDERFAGAGQGSRKKSAARLAQEFLDASGECTWALVTNGRRIRLLRDTETLTRPTYLECDLETILVEERYPDFKALWRIFHASRADRPGSPGTDCIWERWRNEGLAQGNRVREGLRHGVTEALVALGEGFLSHPGNEALRKSLQQGELSSDSLFQQLLRMVYRFLFLFTVEERGILHPPDSTPQAEASRAIYAQGYCLRRLRDRALRRIGYDSYGDLWESVRIVFKGLAYGEPRLALPSLGGLFSTCKCPDLDACALSNRNLLTAMRSLRWSQISGVLSPVDYRNMGFEELGSVYESLLELVPEIDLPARRFTFTGLSGGGIAGTARKTTGSYYTPESLVRELIRSALDPLIKERLHSRPDAPEEALLSITVIDPACGSGHFLIAAARRLAERLSEITARGDIVTPSGYRHALHRVISRCIFGVDRNPLALELARTALWLEGFEPGQALSFLDHHLLCGDALLGTLEFRELASGIPDDAYKQLSGDNKEVCKALGKRNKDGKRRLQALLEGPDLFASAEWKDAFKGVLSVEDMPDSTPQEYADKERAWHAVLDRSQDSPLARSADLYLAAFLTTKSGESAMAATPTTEHIITERFGHDTTPEHEACVQNAREASRQACVLHWRLAFPQIFVKGGFDCVLANPPWERIKLQEEEFFATRHPLVARAKNKAERRKRIEWLSQGMLARNIFPEAGGKEGEADDEKRIYQEFITSRRIAEAASIYAHVKEEDGGRYPLTGVGDVNTYALFAETISRIVNNDGRAGFIVPSGIATDDSTKAYFAHIALKAQLVSLHDFENRERIFPAVDSRMKFCLLTLGPAQESRFSFFLTQTEQLGDASRSFSLSPEDFELINPNTKTCPIFRSRRDAEITRKIYRKVPILIRDAVGEEPEINPWGIRFMAMFHMANDSHLFFDNEASGRLPLYEAKMIHQFDHRWAAYRRSEGGESAIEDVSLANKQDQVYRARPRYWVNEREVIGRIADAPQAVRRAFADGDEHALLAAFANWVEACFEEELGLTAHRIGTMNLTQLAGSVFLELPDPGEWRSERVQREAHRYRSLNTEELGILRTSRDIFEAAEVILDDRSPRWLMGWRDIARATDERTVIASVVPRVGVGHTAPLFILKQGCRLSACFLGNGNSLVLDYVARQKIGGTHLTYAFLKQFPVLDPGAYSELDLAFIVPRVLELTYTSHDLKHWAADLGYTGPPFSFDPVRRAGLRAELDAWYARLYGLNREELNYILDPAEVIGKDYPSETFRVLKKNEEAAFGEYRTRRLVLAAWDRLDQASTSPATPRTTSRMPADIQKTILKTSYPVTELDKTVCGVSLAVLEHISPMSNSDHLYTVLLATHPSWCRAFLSGDEREEFDRITAHVPKILRTDVRGSVQWKRARDYLEKRRAIAIDRSTNAQQILLAGDGVIKQMDLPRPQGDFIELVMKAFSNLTAMKQGLVSPSREQETFLEVIDEKQESEYALAS